MHEIPSARRTARTSPARLSHPRRLAIMIVALLVSLAGCDAGSPPGLDAPEARVPAEIQLLVPAELSGTVGEPLAEPVEARVVNRDGLPVPGVEVHFVVPSEEGSVSPAEVLSDAEGRVRGHWTLGPRAGEQQLELQVAGGEVPFAELTLDALPGAPHELNVFPEAVTIPAGVPFQFGAQVVDAFGNLIATIPVAWDSEDEMVAQVDSDGHVTGLAVGTTTIGARPTEEAAALHPEIVEALTAGPNLHHRPDHAGGRGRVDDTTWCRSWRSFVTSNVGCRESSPSGSSISRTTSRMSCGRTGRVTGSPSFASPGRPARGRSCRST